ncbi:hypothetical protein O3Q51_17000 [Cryomorphaceae bacterium 1068]|nr:hypothetical protein [Cryomorphaceae bacterium 1068]
MKSVFVFLLSLLMLSLVAEAQDKTIPVISETTAAAPGSEEYAMVYYVEGYRWNSVAITYPDGSGKNDSKKFKRSESPRFGNYAWFMPFLNDLIAEGYSIKSHTMSAAVNDDSNVRIHFYVMARAIDRDADTIEPERKIGIEL